MLIDCKGVITILIDLSKFPLVHRQDTGNLKLLYIEDLPLADLAARWGTPLYVYSKARLEANYRRLEQAFTGAGLPYLICYSLKANSNLAIGKILRDLGAGCDIVSGGELERAARIGFPANRLVFAGVGKTEEEIAAALRHGILLFTVESEPELHLINRVAARLDMRAPVAIRVNPNIDARTHPYITTGMREHKFGTPADVVRGMYAEAVRLPHLDVIGIQMHIGSQLIDPQPIVEAARALRGLLDQLEADGIQIRYVDIGGGLGITYKEENPPDPEQLAKAIAPLFQNRGYTILLEPGRYLVGDAGLLLTRVLGLKDNGSKKFVIVDAAMTELIRPALYKAYHEIVPIVQEPNRPEITADVVGPVCESGDFLGLERTLPEPHDGDLLAILSAGAYGYVMASNYNGRCKPAEILVSGDQAYLTRRRETIEDLMRLDVEEGA